jgi:pullulanase/glycogen debranching enzyme
MFFFKPVRYVIYEFHVRIITERAKNLVTGGLKNPL